MDNDQLERLAKVGRQALSIQIIELEYQGRASNGEPIPGDIYTKAAIYNTENISDREVEDAAKTGTINHNSHIIMTDMERAFNVFPHIGEYRKGGGPHAYWKPRGEKNDFIHCECSACGAMFPAHDAIARHGRASTDYLEVSYRFCPRCGSVMHPKPTKGESEEKDGGE